MLITTEGSFVMRLKNTSKLSLLAAALLLTACAMPHNSNQEIISEDTVLPVEEINRMIAEYRTKATDNPSVENLATLNRLLTIRQVNMKREAEEAKAKAAIPKYGEKYKQVSRDYTLDWDNYGRGGAVMRQPAYVHTLSGENNTGPASELNTSFTQNSQNAGGIAAFPVLVDDTFKMGLQIADGAKQQREILSYSIYEMSRWERYCDSGKGMDMRDWAFVREQGLNNVPAHMQANCKPPAKR